MEIGEWLKHNAFVWLKLNVLNINSNKNEKKNWYILKNECLHKKGSMMWIVMSNENQKFKRNRVDWDLNFEGRR